MVISLGFEIRRFSNGDLHAADSQVNSKYVQMDVGTLIDGLSPNIHRSTAIASIIRFACFRLLRVIRFSIAWYHKHYYCAKAYCGVVVLWSGMSLTQTYKALNYTKPDDESSKDKRKRLAEMEGPRTVRRSVRSGSSAAAAPATKLFGLLLAGDRRRDWSAVRDHVLSHPSSAAASYYRDETPLQLALRARERRMRRAEKGHSDANAEDDQPGEVTRIDAL
ncbi:hypothetical protein THAOC_36191, partial [Thalassiosira oceanica]